MRKNVAALNKEPKTRNTRLCVVRKARDSMVRDGLNCPGNGTGDIQYDEGQEQVRASSPLDTIADVACRLGAEIPIMAKHHSNENVLPENAYGQVSPEAGRDTGGSQSPASIPAEETGNALVCERGEKMDEISGDTNVSLRSLFGLLQHYNLGNRMCPKGQYNGEVDVMGGRAMIGKLCEDFHEFKRGVKTKLGEQVREMRQMREEIVSLRRTVLMLESNTEEWPRGLRTRELSGGEYGRDENMIALRADDGAKVSFIVRSLQDYDEDDEIKNEEEVVLTGNELRVGISGNRVGKRGIRPDDMESIGSEANGGDEKRLRRMEMKGNGRMGLTRGESVTGTDSMGNSDRVDWNEGDKMNMKSRWRNIKGRGGKRRRDNWTDEENNEFTAIVLTNQNIDEMSLRRKLARKFSPRRTHEQCANHLRILRSQNKLPAAKEETEEKKKS